MERESDFKLTLNFEKIDDILNKRIHLLDWLMEKKRQEEQEIEALKLVQTRSKKENLIAEDQEEQVGDECFDPDLKDIKINSNDTVQVDKHTILSSYNLAQTGATESLDGSKEKENCPWIKSNNEENDKDKSKSTVEKRAGTGESPFRVTPQEFKAKTVVRKKSSYVPPLDKMRDLFKIENERALIDTLLHDIDQPKMTSQLFNYLEQNDALDYFMSKITLVPVDLDLANVQPSLQKEARTNLASPKEIKGAFKAMEILASVNNFSKKFFQANSQRILALLLRICHDEAKGSFHHFRKIFQLILLRCPDAINIMFEPCVESFGQPPILSILSCIVNSPVQDVLISYFVKANSKASLAQKESLSKGIASCRFVERVFEYMLENGTIQMLHHLTISVDSSEIVLNSFSVLKRIFLSSIRLPPPARLIPALDLPAPSSPTEDESFFLFNDPLLKAESPLKNLVVALNQSSLRADYTLIYIELLHSILMSIGSTLSLVKEMIVPIIISHYQGFASILNNRDSPVILKVLTLDITHVLISHIYSADKSTLTQVDTIDLYEPFFLSIPWKIITDDFFEFHSNCGIYLGRVSNLFQAIVQNENEYCINQLAIAGFFDRLFDQYLDNRVGSDSSAHVSLCISHLLKKPTYDWKKLLSVKLERWEQALELAKDGNGVVYQFIHATMPVIDKSTTLQSDLNRQSDLD